MRKLHNLNILKNQVFENNNKLKIIIKPNNY